MLGPLHLKIFLSSPGDVAEERELARHLIKDELPYDPLLRGKVTFDVFSWDDPAAGVPLLAGMTPQEAVNRVDRPADCDITIVILWSRLGSPLRTDVFRKPNGEPYGSGTEWEYEDARTASRDVLIYRRTATISAWYRREDWETLRDLFPDRSALHATYDEWEADARRVERQLGAQGLAVEHHRRPGGVFRLVRLAGPRARRRRSFSLHNRGASSTPQDKLRARNETLRRAVAG